MNVHTLPLPARAMRPALSAPPQPGFAARPRTYGIDDVARRLGTDRRAAAWQLVNLRNLVLREGFPAPIPFTHRTRMLSGVDAVHPHARWDRRAVDAWFDGLLPPGARDALHAAAADEAGAALDARADDLDALVIAGRRA